MIIYIDIDGVICTQDKKNPGLYKKALPIKRTIDKINKLYDDGHSIILWTARGGTTSIDWRDFTEKQLEVWGVKYHKLSFDKPSFHILIDDKAINHIDKLSI